MSLKTKSCSNEKKGLHNQPLIAENLPFFLVLTICDVTDESDTDTILYALSHSPSLVLR